MKKLDHFSATNAANDFKAKVALPGMSLQYMRNSNLLNAMSATSSLPTNTL